MHVDFFTVFTVVMDEKQRVISKLRVLLACSGRKDATPLHELKFDYCELECTNDIPCFEHKSVADFLMSSGEFSVNIEITGSVTVRGKPKSLSSYPKERSSPGLTAVKSGLICNNQNQEQLTINEMEMTQQNASENGLAAETNIEVNPGLNINEDTSTGLTINQLSEQLDAIIETKSESDQDEFVAVMNAIEEKIVSSHKEIYATDNEENDCISSQVSRQFGISHRCCLMSLSKPQTSLWQESFHDKSE